MPDDLIRVAAGALHTLDLRGVCECGLRTDRDPEVIRIHQARLVLAAVLRAFPQSEAVRVQSRQAAVDTFLRYGQRPGHYDVADAVVAAVARLANA